MRLYSHTIFYAGSCYNVYIQAFRKKGIQLGVYLHRQSNVNPIPAASAPRALNTQPSPSVWPTSLNRSRGIVYLSHWRTARGRLSTQYHLQAPRGTTPGPSSRSPILRPSIPMAIHRAPRYLHSNASFSPVSPSSPSGPPGSHPTASNGNVPNNFYTTC
jgi:hypothetical protein